MKARNNLSNLEKLLNLDFAMDPERKKRFLEELRQYNEGAKE